ncbi:MAG: hypothetical protein KJN63_06065 [Acidimicrobiia bacterium]|nr:hypothetical protein [Acidimicrobiia bacterium]
MTESDPDSPDPAGPVPPPPNPLRLSSVRKAALKRRTRRIEASSSWRAFFAELGLRLAVMGVLIVVLLALDAAR